MLKIRRSLGRLIFNMGIAIPGKTVFLIETAPWSSQTHLPCKQYVSELDRSRPDASCMGPIPGRSFSDTFFCMYKGPWLHVCAFAFGWPLVTKMIHYVLHYRPFGIETCRICQHRFKSRLSKYWRIMVCFQSTCNLQKQLSESKVSKAVQVHIFTLQWRWSHSPFSIRSVRRNHPSNGFTAQSDPLEE